MHELSQPCVIIRDIQTRYAKGRYIQLLLFLLCYIYYWAGSESRAFSGCDL